MKQLFGDKLVEIIPADKEKKIKDLNDEDVQWVVNDLSELGVRIGDKAFFLYKGSSYQGGEYMRPVGKRDFGECVHPVDSGKVRNYVGHYGEQLEMWEYIK